MKSKVFNIDCIKIMENHNKFNNELQKAMDNCLGCSFYRNDRKRPYDGQSHTHYGERGKQLVIGLTMRDVADCIIQGFLSSSSSNLQHKVVERNKEFIGTKYASNNTWIPDDVYKIEADIDPIAVVQNTLCMIEHYMNIYPNLSYEKRSSQH